MKALFLAIASGALLVASGCRTVGSLQPLYTKTDKAVDLSLEGNWTDSKDEVLVRIRNTKTGLEVITIENQNSDTKGYNVRLVQLGSANFADISSVNRADLAAQVHVLAKVWFEGTELCAGILSTTWLEQKARESGIPSTNSGDDLYFTAPTPVLRAFVQQYGADAQAIDPDIIRLRRIY